MQSASTLYFLVSLAGFVCVTNGQCDLAVYHRAIDVQSCSTNGGINIPLGESSRISNGTVCNLNCIDDGSARTMACVHDTWRFEPSECTDGSTGVVRREKRFLGTILCWIFCGRSRPSPPPDRTPPHVFCPPDIHRYADPIQTSTKIHWDESVAYAVDDRDGRISATRWSRKGPSYLFWDVTDVFYYASDRAGNNGYCKMKITVTTIRCSPDPNRYFRNGYYLCHPSSDFVYGTTCNYGCYYGYRIAGPKRRECLKSGRWSSAEPQCEVVTCPPLLPFPDGIFQCTDGTNFKSACSYICKAGYDVAPGTSRVRVCGYDGQWRGPVPVCTDSEPPKFTNCPRVLTYFTAKGSSKALVDWNIPSVTDNSRQTVSPTQISGISNTDYHPSGVYEIVYKAVDGAGNEARLCKFKVVVKELRCFPQYPLPYMRVDCPSGYRYGAMCNFSCDSGYAINGSNTAVCERSNTYPPYTYWKMTSPTCEAQSTCPALTPPDNGALACDLWEDGSFCQMQCRNGTDIPPSFSSWKLFVCNIHGSWNFDGNIPPCSKIRNTQRTRMTAKIYYFDGSCPDVMNTIKENFLSALRRSPFNSFLDSSKMTVENVKVTCGAVRETRSVDSSDSHRVTTQVDLVSTMTEAQSKTAFKESEKQSHDLLQLMADDIKGENSKLFPHLENNSSSGVESSEVNLDCPAGTLPSYRTTSCVSCTAGTYFASNKCKPCRIGYYQPQQGQTECLQCPQGKTTLREEASNVDKCLPMCQLGYFSANGVEPCTPCDFGQYADEIGVKACKVCPVSMTTMQVGSTGLLSCIHFDISLTNVSTSYAKLEMMVDSVDLGTGFSLRLWVVMDSENGDIFTLKSSTDDLFSLHTDDQLQLIFSTSSSSALGFTLEKATWYHIQLNYDSAILTVYVDGTKVLEKGRTETKWTARDSLLVIIGGSGFEGSVSQINMWKDVQTPSVKPACFTDDVGDVLAWDNFTLCNMTDAFLQVPSECDDSDDCLSGPCIHGDCTNVLNGYTCSCKEGYSGKDCDVNIDDCVAHRCINGGTCVDAVSNYTCVCTPDYTGEFCDANIVHGGWGEWGNWTECSKTCGPGERSRLRRCDNPVPQNGGVSCSGPDKEVGTCNDSECPVCPEPSPSPNGKLECEDQVGMRRCELKCEEGYDLDREPLTRYECGQETGYKWNYVTSDNPEERLPNCMEIQASSETEVRFGADYLDMKCDGNSANIQIIDNTVRQEANKIPCIRDNSCYIKNTIVNNNCNGSRQTRDIVLAHFTIVLANNPSITGIQSGLEALLTAVTQLNSSAESGVFTLTIGGVKYYLSSSPVTSGHVTCRSGWTRVNFYCVPCGPGTYYTNGYCERCDIGLYNSVTGATSCHKCPTGKITPGRGSHSVDECTVDVDVPSAIEVVAIVLGVLGPCLLITVIIVTFICIKWKKRKAKVHSPKASLNNPCGPVIEAWGPGPTVSVITSSLPNDTRHHKMKLDLGYPAKVPVLGMEEIDHDSTR